MVRADLLVAKTAKASAWLEAAEPTLSLPLDEYLADLRGRDLAAFYLFLAIQECIDLAAHWVSSSGWLPPDDAAAAFHTLADHGIIGRDLADGMRKAAGLRDRIAHGYALLDHRRLHTEASAGLSTLRRYLVALAEAAGL